MTFVVTFLLQCDQLNLVGKQVVGRKQKFKMASKCLPLLCSSIPPFRASCSPRDPEPLGCNFIPCFSALVVGCSQRMLVPKAEESGLFLTCAFRLILKMLKSASDLLTHQWDSNGQRTVVQTPLPWRFARLFRKEEE